MKSPKYVSLVLSTLLLTMGLNVTACSKHEGGEGKPTEEIAAEQGELARQKNPAPAASQPATPMQTASATTATASTVIATASTVTVTTTKTETIASANTATATAGNNEAGEKLYASTCKTCHETGLAGAPKIGDGAAWKDRIAQGNDTLHKHAIEGYQGKAGMMPAKGGNATASNDDVKAAVDYMVAKSK